MSYDRTYENITLKYSLPYSMFHPSRILKDYVDEISYQKGISPEKVIDSYVNIYLQDMNNKITHMISHDGNLLFKDIKSDCIIDEVLDEDEIIRGLLKSYLNREDHNE